MARLRWPPRRERAAKQALATDACARGRPAEEGCCVRRLVDIVEAQLKHGIGSQNLNRPIDVLERSLLPLCETARDALVLEFPACQIGVWSGAVGSLTTYQGHDLGVAVVLPDMPHRHADNVSLIVGIKHVTTRPMLAGAAVSWGAGEHPAVGIELLKRPVRFTTRSLTDIERQFPELVDTLRAGIVAGLQRSLSNKR